MPDSTAGGRDLVRSAKYPGGMTNGWSGVVGKSVKFNGGDSRGQYSVPDTAGAFDGFDAITVEAWTWQDDHDPVDNRKQRSIVRKYSNAAWAYALVEDGYAADSANAVYGGKYTYAFNVGGAGKNIWFAAEESQKPPRATWSHGRSSAKIAKALDCGIVNVRVADCLPEYESGYRLKLTVASEGGRRTATQFVDFSGAGSYSFDTANSSDPAICASGYGYNYTVELVDAGGARVPNSDIAAGEMRVGVSKGWFSARAADDSSTGGGWSAKPPITEGRFAVAEGAEFNFAAAEPHGGRVRYESHAEFKGFVSDYLATKMLSEVASSHSMPHGACFMAKGDADDTPVWRALVSDGGEPAFKTLLGPAALNTPCRVVCEVDWSSGAARVRYSVSVAGTETVLADADGEMWFPGASSASVAAGRVAVSGTGLVSSVCGRSILRNLLKCFSVTIR